MNGTPQRLDVVFHIVWQANWHAGSGEGSAGIDRLVRRLPRPKKGKKGLPFLPGAQLKGVLRHQCERLAALFGCDVVSPHQVGGELPQELLNHFRPLAVSGLLIDRLFGTRYQGDCLFVDDATPDTQDGWESRPHSRTAIDRLSRTARDQTLFVSEVVTGHGRRLRGSLRARHPSGVLTQYDDGFPLEYALLLAGLRTVESLGGSRSSGMGSCCIEIAGEVVRWNGKEIPVDEALGSFAEGWKEMLDLAREGGA